MSESVIVEAVRTPMGKRNGVFKEVRSDTLGAACLTKIVERTGINAEDVEDVVMGCVTCVGEQGLNVAKNVALSAWFPVTVPGTTINRMCASGLQAVTFANNWIVSGMMDITIGGGIESMTRVAMGSDGGALNPVITERFNIIPQGLSAELVAEKYGITRKELDEFSYQSHMKAAKAREMGFFKDEIVPIEVIVNGKKIIVDQDETIRPDATIEKLAKLPPAFKPDGGLITAGNSSQITDGASAVMFMSAKKAKELGVKPMARIISTAVASVEPTIMLTGPIPAVRKVFKKTGMSLKDIDLIEINEAFASVVLACGRELGFDWEKVNVNGGACALGHPLGATGARLLTSIIYELKRRNGKYGLVTLCVGFGQGIATIVENLK